VFPVGVLKLMVGKMAYALPSEGVLDYFPCRYGVSNMSFRGPRRSLERPYIVFLGGNETYGKFIPDPFPDLVEEEVGYGAVNLGIPNAGPDVYLKEPSLIELAQGAEAVVVQVLGAGNLSNRYYKVHPRRNDRFVGPTPLLRALYRDVDFTEITFTRHLLATLYDHSPEKFQTVAEDLRATWHRQMEALLSQLPERTVLLWLSDQPPPSRVMGPGHDPVLIDAETLASVRPMVRTYIEAVERGDQRGRGLSGMAFSRDESEAAARMPGPEVHRDLSRLLSNALEKILK